MPALKRLSYFQRIFAAYLFTKESQLSFWHDEPRVCEEAFLRPQERLYYMDFSQKARYTALLDKHGIPLLNYHGSIGPQYNPIAISQYGLGNFNLYKISRDREAWIKCVRAADWLVEHLEKNKQGHAVWMHHFDWDYAKPLRAPWYSGLAQGQGISLLYRVFRETRDIKYKKTMQKAYAVFQHQIEQGGVIFFDDKKNVWIEEYITDPPTHILNGFIWALWGVYDYFLCIQTRDIYTLWHAGLQTLQHALQCYDIKYWSRYDLSKTKLDNVASLFYHTLHIIQLDVLYRLTKMHIFKAYKEAWQQYAISRLCRMRAVVQKSIFKLVYF